MSRTPPADWAPWTIAGDPDPDFDDADRVMHHLALTDRNLLKRYKQQFPDADADYDAIVRRLGHVWDCPEDRAANVAGFRCASCGRTRAQALERSRAINLRSGGQPRRAGSENVAYVRRLCRAFAEDGVDGLVELAPDDVEWI